MRSPICMCACIQCSTPEVICLPRVVQVSELKEELGRKAKEAMKAASENDRLEKELTAKKEEVRVRVRVRVRVVMKAAEEALALAVETVLE